MNEFEKEALEKIKAEFPKGAYSVRANAMKTAVRGALEDFIRQDGEFAQAVVQSKGTFCDCMEAVAHGVGSSISDLEAYRRAVQFYFPGAEIRMTMTIDLIGKAGEDAKAPEREVKKAVILDLNDFL